MKKIVQESRKAITKYIFFCDSIIKKKYKSQK